MNITDHSDELTPEERDAFAGLPRERVPPAALEDRVVAALGAEGLLGHAHRPPRTRAGRSRAWLAAAVAAGVALFASGVAVGEWRTGRGLGDAVSAALEGTPDAAQAATEVQEAGSEYVRAVARLAELSGGDSRGEVASGAEAAQVALRAAALELQRLNPDDATLRLVLAVLEERAGDAADTTTAAARKTIWF